MKSSNEHIEKYLDWYLDPFQNSSPDFAVLINGGWGCGKTTFIKKYLKYKYPLVDNLTGVKTLTIYVSLFGVKSRNEIDDKIKDEIKPLFGTEDFKFAGKALWNVVKIATILKGNESGARAIDESEKILKTLGEKITKTNSEGKSVGNLKNIAVVFDDVERAELPLSELLGFVNEYVEHQSLPCILLADADVWEKTSENNNSKAIVYRLESEKREQWLEAEFTNEKSTLRSLSTVKEKVIGKTFLIQTQPDEVIQYWIDRDTSPLGDRARETLDSRVEILHKVFASAQKKNFRAFKHTLMDFQRFIGSPQDPVLEDKHLKSTEFMDRFITDFMTIQYWNHLGILKTEEVGKSKSMERALSYYSTSSQKIQLTAWENLHDKVSEIGGLLGQMYSTDKGGWENLWKTWLGENWISPTIVQSLVNDTIWFDKKDQYWTQKYLEWTRLTDEEFRKAKDAFESALNDQSITNPSLILKYFDLILWSSKNGALEKTPNQILEEFTLYVNNLGERLEVKQINESTDFLTLSCENDKEEIEFRGHLDETLGLLLEGEKQNFTEGFIQLMIDDPHEAAKSLTNLNSNNDQNTIKFMDVNKFLDNFVNLNTHSSSLIFENLKNRFHNVDVCNWLLQEKAFLTDLKLESQRRLDDTEKPLPPSVFRLYYLNQRIDDSLEYLRKTQEKLNNQKKQSESKEVNDV